MPHTAGRPPATAPARHRTAAAALALVLGLLAGCAAGPGAREGAAVDAARPQGLPVDAAPALQACLALYRQVDAAVDGAGVRDAQTHRPGGFPYLRADRLLASFATDTLAAPARRAWVEAMAAREHAARRAELANLRPWPEALQEREALSAALQDCSARLRQRLLEEPSALARLREAVQVPPAYSQAARLLGLYPLSARLALAGITSLHEEGAERFAAARTEPARQSLEYYPAGAGAPLPAADVARLLRESADNPLGLPLPAGGDLKRLFDSFAPVYSIDTRVAWDRPGEPLWRDAADAHPRVNAAAPVVYRLLSHTRYGEALLLQLNYVLWFPGRPADGPFDLLAGRLDGLTLRVTLGPDGRPLLYDSMHNCGCYHMYYPGPGLSLRAGATGEPPWVPMRAPVLAPGERLRVHLQSASHYVEALTAAAPGAGQTPRIGYRMEDYQRLRSLPVQSGGRRSLFGGDGLVPGTQRAERWLLWPMGVPSAGAMRQWGHHATAFVGQRHFDDPRLLERYFRWEDAP